MKVSRAKEYLPFVQALAEGRTIQQRYLGKWLDHEEDSITFCGRPEDYRIKPTSPTPTLRPWKPEEVLVGALYKHKHSARIYFLTYADIMENCFRFAGFDVQNIEASCFEHFQYSLDHGKTWHPCGIVE